MATHKSAKKRARQSAFRQVVQNNIKGHVRSKGKEFLSLIGKKDMVQSKKALSELLTLIDKTKSKGVFSLNKAARLKSRFFQTLKKAEAQK